MMAKNGLHLITPTSIAYTGTSATIGANGSVSFSAVTSLSLNGVFTADYDNYMIVMRHIGSGSVEVTFKMRVAGADNSTANSYVFQLLSALNTTVSGQRYTQTPSLNQARAAYAGFVANFYGPYLAQPTAYRCVTINNDNGGRIYDPAGTHNQSISYDGLSFIADGGTFSGLVGVYGMRK